MCELPASGRQDVGWELQTRFWEGGTSRITLRLKFNMWCRWVLTWEAGEVLGGEAEGIRAEGLPGAAER